jgi:hypothetical protein
LLKPFEGSRHWFPPFLNVLKAFRLWRKKKKPSIPTYKFGAHPSLGKFTQQAHSQERPRR